MHSPKLGTRIRAMREERKLSRDELARKAQISLERLSAIEDLGESPALGVLVKISRALGARLGTFTDDVMGQDPCVVRAEERQGASLAQTGVHRPGHMDYHCLGRGKADRHMEPFYIEMEPGGTETEPGSHEGEEFIVVLRGRVRLVYGAQTVVLNPGDSAYYNSVVPHLVACEGEEPAAIHAVVYVPF